MYVGFPWYEYILLKDKSNHFFIRFIDLLLLLVDIAKGDSLHIHLGVTEASRDSAWRYVNGVRD